MKKEIVTTALIMGIMVIGAQGNLFAEDKEETLTAEKQLAMFQNQQYKVRDLQNVTKNEEVKLQEMTSKMVSEFKLDAKKLEAGEYAYDFQAKKIVLKADVIPVVASTPVVTEPEQHAVSEQPSETMEMMDTQPMEEEMKMTDEEVMGGSDMANQAEPEADPKAEGKKGWF